MTIEFGAFKALQGLSFTLPGGAFTALIGPNGAGKSSLLRCIGRALQPSRGAVYLDDKDLQKLPLGETARTMAVVPQDTSVDFDFSVRELVMMGRYPHQGRFRGGNAKDRKIVHEALVATGITHLAAKSVTQLSGGERQRVIIARALAQEPELLLLDEPTANLDINFQVEFLELLHKLNRTKGITILAAIHDLNLAAQYFASFVLLADKKVLAIGRPEEVLTPENIYNSYGTAVAVQRNPLHGKLGITVLKQRDNEEKTGGNKNMKIHVIGGGEEAVSVLSQLIEAGYQLAVGPVTRADSSYQFAAYHHLPVITLPPFSPITDLCYNRHLAMMKEAGAVVVPSISFGPGNLRNLEAVAELCPLLPVYLIDEEPLHTRDYTTGQARVLYEKMRKKGARTFSSCEELLLYLEAEKAYA
ncbi:MAG: ABC transporter ATP-binding protein [Dethiobacteria bacterium]